MRLFPIVFLAVLLALPALAPAQQQTGSVSGVLAGETRTWYITETPEMSQSDWSGNASWAEVSIVAHATPDTIMNSREALLLSFESTGTGPAQGVEIRFLAEGLSKAYVADSDSGASVVVEQLSVAGDRLTLSGSFSATLGWTENYGINVDMTNTRDVSGTFTGTIGPVR